MSMEGVKREFRCKEVSKRAWQRGKAEERSKKNVRGGGGEPARGGGGIQILRVGTHWKEGILREKRRAEEEWGKKGEGGRQGGLPLSFRMGRAMPSRAADRKKKRVREKETMFRQEKVLRREGPLCGLRHFLVKTRSPRRKRGKGNKESEAVETGSFAMAKFPRGDALKRKKTTRKWLLKKEWGKNYSDLLEKRTDSVERMGGWPRKEARHIGK